MRSQWFVWARRLHSGAPMRTTWAMASVLLACGGGSNEPSADAGMPSTILGTPVSADEAQPWNGMAPIEVISQNGDITIIGDSSDGKIHITGTPFVVAVAGDAGRVEAVEGAAVTLRRAAKFPCSGAK